MLPAPLKRQQRLKLERLAERVDRVTRADRLFFERRPDRKFRFRLAAQCEIDTEENLTGAALYVPAGTRIFVVICNIAPGARLRMFLRGMEGADTDLDEASCRAIYEGLATGNTRKIEAQMRAAARA